MSLNQNFIEALDRASIKTNVAVVFSPKDNFCSEFFDGRPFSNQNFNASQSFILWKREPDLTERGSKTIEKEFKEFLTGNLPAAGDVPLECIDSVTLNGSEIDIKDATVQDDSVDISLVLQDIEHKSFFQGLLGYNVEVYFGFNDQSFNFFDYERFYVGRLNAISSDSNLTLTLKVGTLADFWNRPWEHTNGLRNTKLVHDYPTSFGIYTHPGSTVHAVKTRLEFWLRYAIDKVTKFGFDFKYRRPIDRIIQRTRLGVSLSNILVPGQPTGGRRGFNRHFYYQSHGLPTPESTSVLFFQPSGTTTQIARSAPEFLENDRDYPRDNGFLRARRAPTEQNKIRFRVGDLICESAYTDTIVFYPFLVMPTTDLAGTTPLDAKWRDNSKVSPTGLNYFYQVDRVASDPDTSESVRASWINAFSIFKNYYLGVFIDKTDTCRRDSDEDFITCDAQPDPDRYTSLDAKLLNFKHINQLQFATKLKFFKVPDENETAPEFKKNDEVSFYDVSTGIGSLDEVLVETLERNLGINAKLIDIHSFQTANQNYLNRMDIPYSKLRGLNQLLSKERLNFDYSFDGSSDATGLVQDKILKSNNLRVVLDGGVLKCLFVNLINKPVLTENVNNEDVPFLITEDDILESTTYQTRQEDHIRRIKITTGHKDERDTSPLMTFYAIDQRDDQRRGRIEIFDRLPDAFREDDFEEVELSHNFCDSDTTQDFDEFRGRFGFINQPYFSLNRRERRDLVSIWARDYFDVVNPSVKLTVTTSRRGLSVNVGDIIELRDHKAFELFGSQFIKAFVLNKSINEWGTANVNVTLDLLYVGPSLNYVTARRPSAPRRFREISKTQSSAAPTQSTDVSLKFDAPNDWGQNEKTDLHTYKLYSSTPTGDFLLATLSATSNSSEAKIRWVADERSLVLTLDNDQTFRLFLRADNGAFESTASNVLEIETLESINAPAPPTNLRLTGSTREAFSLAWDESSDFGGDLSVSYNVYVDGDFVANTASTLSFDYYFLDHEPGDRLRVYVTAQNREDESGPSNELVFTVPQRLPVPEGVITLTGVPVSTSQVDLTWSATITRGDEGVEYDLYRSNLLGDGGQVIVEGLVDATMRDENLEEATTYFYKVVARNASGDGVESPQVRVTTLAEVLRTRPEPPRGFRFG